MPAEARVLRAASVDRRPHPHYCLRQGITGIGPAKPPGRPLWRKLGRTYRTYRTRTRAQREGRNFGGLLADEVRLHRSAPPSDLATVDRGDRARTGTRVGDPREQPPVVLRLVLHAADGAAQGHVPREGGVLHHTGSQGLALPKVL